MTAPTSGRDDATMRGAVVLVVAIVIGLALLVRSGSDGGDETADSTTTSAAETTASTDASGSTVSLPAPVQDSSTTTAPLTTADPAGILVAVLNATETVGLAGTKADLIASAGYMTDEANVAGSNTDTTTIYATAEAQADANAIKSLLGLGGATVTEKPAEALAANGEDAAADVVVVLGSDSAGGGGTDAETSVPE